MTREEKRKVIDALKISAPIMAMTQEEFNDYIQTLNEVMDWLEQEPCEDEYIKVPKKALKYRTSGMVAYNTEWLKNHFDIERAVICGAQEPCEDAISREKAKQFLYERLDRLNDDELYDIFSRIIDDMYNDLPSVKPQEPKWIPVSERLPNKSGKYWCTFGGTYLTGTDFYITKDDAEMDFEEPEEYVGWQSQNVIAWMPMPESFEPYEVEGSDEK